MLTRMYRMRYLVSLILSVLVIGAGGSTLAKGRLGYYNYRHLIVFAPFALVLGFGFLWVTLVLWTRARTRPDAGDATNPDRFSPAPDR